MRTAGAHTHHAVGLSANSPGNCWLVEDRDNRSVDVLVITSFSLDWHMLFPGRIRKVAKKLWDNYFGSMVSLNICTLTREQILKVNGGTKRINRTSGDRLRSLPLQSKEMSTFDSVHDLCL